LTINKAWFFADAQRAIQLNNNTSPGHRIDNNTRRITFVATFDVFVLKNVTR
jgi:hypothetical protein